MAGNVVQTLNTVTQFDASAAIVNANNPPPFVSVDLHPQGSEGIYIDGISCTLLTFATTDKGKIEYATIALQRGVQSNVNASPVADENLRDMLFYRIFNLALTAGDLGKDFMFTQPIYLAPNNTYRILFYMTPNANTFTAPVRLTMLPLGRSVNTSGKAFPFVER